VIFDGAQLQGQLLGRAAQWLRPGGTLVYSVCSLEPPEGEEVISAFLNEHSEFRLDRPNDLPDFLPISAEGWVRILPGLLEEQGGLDGFFMACLVRGG
jgi:16S rRNA (cytosine967-C5)-methyltransferase